MFIKEDQKSLRSHTREDPEVSDMASSSTPPPTSALTMKPYCIQALQECTVETRSGPVRVLVGSVKSLLPAQRDALRSEFWEDSKNSIRIPSTEEEFKKDMGDMHDEFMDVAFSLSDSPENNDEVYKVVNDYLSGTCDDEWQEVQILSTRRVAAFSSEVRGKNGGFQGPTLVGALPYPNFWINDAKNPGHQYVCEIRMERLDYMQVPSHVADSVKNVSDFGPGHMYRTFYTPTYTASFGLKVMRVPKHETEFWRKIDEKQRKEEEEKEGGVKEDGVKEEEKKEEKEEDEDGGKEEKMEDGKITGRRKKHRNI